VRILSASSIIAKAQLASEAVDRFLDYIGEGNVDEIYLYGSIPQGRATEKSDIDLMFVGEDFDDMEDERIRMGEEGELPPGCRLLDVGVDKHAKAYSPDVLFSSKSPQEMPRSYRPAIRLYPGATGGWISTDELEREFAKLEKKK
jgi:hypothetical protein